MNNLTTTDEAIIIDSLNYRLDLLKEKALVFDDEPIVIESVRNEIYRIEMLLLKINP